MLVNLAEYIAKNMFLYSAEYVALFSRISGFKHIINLL